MSHYVFSPLAREDLEKIWDYSAQRWNADQAERYLRQIQAAVETIATEPGIGRSCEEIRAGYRKHQVGSHVIFFRLTVHGIDIIRILHSRMDFRQHLT